MLNHSPPRPHNRAYLSQGLLHDKQQLPRIRIVTISCDASKNILTASSMASLSLLGMVTSRTMRVVST